MKQFLFVRRDSQIASWKWQRGGLRIAALNGNEWSDFGPSYWDEWKDANQVTDVVDAILLSNAADGFGSFPDWLSAVDAPSAWTIEQIVLLADDETFGETAFALTQGKNRKLIGDADSAAPVSYALQSTCQFALPKEETKPGAAPAKPKEKSAPKSQACADSYGDKKALALKVGDKVSVTISVVAPARGCYYAKSDALDDLIKIKMSFLPSSVSFKVGDAITFIVLDVSGECVKYSLTDAENYIRQSM